MQDTLTINLAIRGQFCAPQFIDWINDRAQRLCIDVAFGPYSKGCLDVVMTGERVLLEAMAVACSLGPMAARVATVTSNELNTGNTACGQASPQQCA